METKNLYKSAGVIIFISILGKVLGFIRDASIANSFGATYKTDAYNIALVIPIMLFSIIGDSVTTAFIPLLSESYKKNENHNMFSFVNTILNILILVTFALCIAAVLFTPQIVSFIAPKFTGERYLITIRLTRISIFSMVFMSIAACYTALLQTMEDFTGPALMGIAVSVPIILYSIAGSSYDIYGLVVFALIGYVIQALIQWPWLMKNKYKYSFKINWKDTRIKRLLYLIAPVILGTVANQINILVEKAMASGLPEGSIAALDYGNKINTMIYTTFALAVVTVVFPALSLDGLNKNYKDFKKHLRNSINGINIIMIPSAIIVVIFKTAIVSVLFKRGAFDSKAVAMTSDVLLYLSIGIMFYGIRDICNKAFYALKDTKTPMINGIIGVVACILMNLIVVKYMGIKGLALSSTVSVILCSMLLMIMLNKRIKCFDFKEMFYDAVNILLSCGFMAFVMYFSNSFITAAITGYKGEIISLFCSVFIGITFYVTMLILLNVKEVFIIKKILSEKKGGDLMKCEVKYIFIGVLVVLAILVSAIVYNRFNKVKTIAPAAEKVKVETPVISNISVTKRDLNTLKVEVNVKALENKKILYQIWAQSYDGWILIREYDSSPSCIWVPAKDIKEYSRIQVKIKDSKSGTIYNQKMKEISYSELGILKLNNIFTDTIFQGYGEVSKPVKITVNASGVKDIMYQYFVSKGTAYEKLSEYTNSNSFTWIPERGGNCRVLVKVKDKSSYQFDEMSIPFIITGDSYKIPELKDVIIESTGKGKPLRIKGVSVENSSSQQFMFSIGESLRTPDIIQDYSNKSQCLWNAEKSGIYQIMAYIKDKNSLQYDDGLVKVYQVKTSDVKNVKLNSVDLSETKLTQPIGSKLKFTANASGGNKLLYSFWRLESNGHKLIKDYSESNTLTWIPERPGVYTILVRVKDINSGSYEDEMSVTYNIIDYNDRTVKVKEITVTGDLKKRSPEIIKALALDNRPIMYQFFVISDFLGCEKLQEFSASNTCIWTPRKAGKYKIEVWIKDENSDSYDVSLVKEINITE